MKKTLAIVLAILSIYSVNAQKKANTITPYFKITLDETQFTGTCNLSGVSTVYMHSGAGSTSDTAVWEHIVGHWGRADGIGKMTMDSANHYSICFNIFDYYSQATMDTNNLGGAGIGPLLQGETVYNIGCVFRDESCAIGGNGLPQCDDAQTGKDPNCRDIYIFDMQENYGGPTVLDYSGDPFPAITAEYVESCGATGIKEVNKQEGLNVFPNPFKTYVNAQFDLKNATNSKLEIYDLMGKKVADLTESLNAGANSITWNGTNLNGEALAGGVYVMKLYDGSNWFVSKVVKQ